MFKMSTGVAALLVAGLLGLACTNQGGLNPGEKPGGAGGAAKRGQMGGVAGGAGGTIGVGGIVTGGSGGTIGTGGVGAGGPSGTGGCWPAWAGTYRIQSLVAVPSAPRLLTLA